MSITKVPFKSGVNMHVLSGLDTYVSRFRSQPLSSIEGCVCNPCDLARALACHQCDKHIFHIFMRAGPSGKK